MSPLPGSGGGRARSPCEAQRPTDDRRTGPRRGCLLPSVRQRARLVEISADFEQARVTLIAAARSAAALQPSTQLLLADDGESGAEPLVLDNRALRDLAQLVEGAVGQLHTFVTDRQPAVGMIDHRHPFADRRLSLVARLQDEDHLVVLEGQRPRQRALLLPGEGIRQIIALAQWPVQILAVHRQLGKARIVVGHERREEGIPRGQAGCSGEPHSLTSRSCKVLCARSTRPFAWLELAQMMSMLSASRARPNWVIPSPPIAPSWLTRKTPCLSL